MAGLTLVLGGVRSGKSRFAEQLATAWPSVTYLATAQAGDEEMAQRIALHRQRRDPLWKTIEEPWDLAKVIAGLVGPGAAGQGLTGCVLVECLPLWLTNQLVGLPQRPGRGDPEILAEVTEVAEIARAGSAKVVVVSNEVGCGILPANALARRFADLLGEANQRLAAGAEAVYACLAGIPLRVH